MVKVNLVTAALVAFGLMFSGCTPTKKLACDQVPAVSAKVAGSLSEVLECSEVDLMAADVEQNLNGVLGCNKDAGLLREVCKIAVTQSINLIPEEAYTTYKCNLKAVAGKVEPYAVQACDLIQDD